MEFLIYIAIGLLVFFLGKSLFRSFLTREIPPIHKITDTCEGPHKWTTIEDHLGPGMWKRLKKIYPDNLSSMFCSECGLLVGSELGVDIERLKAACKEQFNRERKYGRKI